MTSIIILNLKISPQRFQEAKSPISSPQEVSGSARIRTPLSLMVNLYVLHTTVPSHFLNKLFLTNELFLLSKLEIKANLETVKCTVTVKYSPKKSFNLLNLLGIRFCKIWPLDEQSDAA